MIITSPQLEELHNNIRKLDGCGDLSLINYYENNIKRLREYIYTYARSKIKELKENDNTN